MASFGGEAKFQFSLQYGFYVQRSPVRMCDTRVSDRLQKHQRYLRTSTFLFSTIRRPRHCKGVGTVELLTLPTLHQKTKKKEGSILGMEILRGTRQVSGAPRTVTKVVDLSLM